MKDANQLTIDESIAKFKAQFLSHWQNTSMLKGELNNVLIISVSDGNKRAKVKTVWLEALSNVQHQSNAIWDKVAKVLDKASINELAKKFEQPITDIRIEWVVSESYTTWGDFQDILKQFKRNYYRSGIAFKGTREPWILLTEMELNANACLYQGAEVVHARVNDKNLSLYLKARHGSSQIPEFKDELAMMVFNTSGIYIDLSEMQYHRLETAPRNKGRRELLPLSFDSLLPIIEQSTQYLSEQVQPSGRYIYGYFPCFNRQIDTYNNLRHASSTYALIEGYEACKNYKRTEVNSVNQANNISKSSKDEVDFEQLEQSIKDALSYLVNDLIVHYDHDLAYVVEQNNEIKLGANAVAILALVKYTQVFNDENYLPLLEQLANGILAMQQNSGQFVHVLNSADLTVKQESRIIYYDGEAAFALMRLYGLTQDERWLNCVIKAFDYFIEARHDRAHDHWLSYCSNELVKYKPERQYFEFAVRNIKGYTHFIKNRITTFPTLLELCMAFHKMLLTLDDYPQFYEVLDDFDVQDFYQALHSRANYLVNGYFFPEVAMYFKAPNTIKHGFFIRHHAFRVRIDDVEHYLSGLVAYANFIKDAHYPKLAAQNQSDHFNSNSDANGAKNPLTKALLVEATKGQWVVLPGKDWSASGLCIWAKSFKSGHIVVARSKSQTKGYLPSVAIKSLVLKGAAAIITDSASDYLEMGVPVLLVSDVRQAVLNIGHLCRKMFDGKVIGVTGSAGKTTTVNMLAHTLSSEKKTLHEVAQTQSSANLPVGIAWNMASMPQQASFWVLEMAIGSMTVNSDLVRPNIALITNIAAAHLEYHYTLDNIAIKKSQIFEGMAAGSVAVICRDIEQYDIIANLAHVQGLKIISYGQHPSADIRLLDYHDGNARISLGNDATYQLRLTARGQHMALNALAVLAVVTSCNLPIEPAIKQLETFKAIAGRGEVIETMYQQKAITIYDDAYNANPLSMAAALEAFSTSDKPANHRVLILGDMLELGTDSQAYHLGLIPQILATQAHCIILCGEEMASVYQNIQQQLADSNLESQQYKPQVQWVKSSKSVIEIFKKGDINLQDGDEILIKSSHGTGLYQLVEHFKIAH